MTTTRGRRHHVTRRIRRAAATLLALLAFLAGVVATAPGGAALSAAAPAGQATSVAVSQDFTCVLTASGGVECFGANPGGVLGDGSTVRNRPRPGPVTGLSSGVTSLATGRSHACAVTGAGGVRCWGFNGNGQLGDGSSQSHSTPVDVVGLTSGVQSVSAGQYHSCALMTAGTVKCWGYGGDGELGTGTTDSSPTPVDVVGLAAGVRSITVGGVHSCALTPTGVSCWGANSLGQIGDATRDTRLTPTAVRGLGSDVSSVSA